METSQPITHIRWGMAEVASQNHWPSYCGLKAPMSSISAQMMREIVTEQVVPFADCVNICQICFARFEREGS